MSRCFRPQNACRKPSFGASHASKTKLMPQLSLPKLYYSLLRHVKTYKLAGISPVEAFSIPRRWLEELLEAPEPHLEVSTPLEAFSEPHLVSSIERRCLLSV